MVPNGNKRLSAKSDVAKRDTSPFQQFPFPSSCIPFYSRATFLIIFFVRSTGAFTQRSSTSIGFEEKFRRRKNERSLGVNAPQGSRDRFDSLFPRRSRYRLFKTVHRFIAYSLCPTHFNVRKLVFINVYNKDRYVLFNSFFSFSIFWLVTLCFHHFDINFCYPLCV